MARTSAPVVARTDRTVAVAARGLTKLFGDLVAVDGIDFEAPARACFGFLGPNGAGKTTTMRMVACRTPPSGGSLEVLGRSVEDEPRAIKTAMGVVPQEENLDEEISVLENLVIYGRYYGLPPKLSVPRATELLEFMQLADKRDRLIGDLSGGMKRRLLIARALLNEPEILVLDEPTTGLDPQARHLVWEKLRTLKRSGVTLLLTTHYMDEASQLCDRLVIMHEGKILVEGSPRALVKAHTTRQVVEVFEPPGTCTTDLETIASTAEHAERLADRWLLYTDDGEAMLAKVRALGLDPSSVWLRGGTLEDVFLAMTGRRLIE
jgi:lipooligosaccharide transport system ATP-binding protein